MKLIFLLILTTIGFKCKSNAEKVFIRKNSKDLSFNEWKDFKRGIKLMKEKHIRNPLGYDFQANVHGWSKYDGSDTANFLADHFNWHKCMHKQYFFLVWHRMYLYFFERILKRVTGNPNLTVPYWDYSDPTQRELPQPFRIPANESSNTLYVSERCKIINDGRPLPAEMTDPMPALSSRFFTANKSNELNVCHSFGGGRIEKPAFLSDRGGMMERLPHDRIHVYIGGSDGMMSDLCKSARDPIFWLNHCMTDRVWESWLQLGGKHLTEDNYLNQSFQFYDENGVLGTYFVKDFLNTTKLNYRYDSLIKTDQKIETTDNESPELFFSVDETKDLYINSKKRSIILKIKPNFYTLFDNIAKGRVDQKRIRFTLQMVLGGSNSGLLYQLYMNLPKETLPYEDRVNFIGTIVFFEEKCIPRKKRKSLGITNCFDITNNLFTIFKSEYNYNGIVPRYLNLTVVPKSCDSEYYPESDENLIKFDRSLLVHHYV